MSLTAAAAKVQTPMANIRLQVVSASR